MTQYTLDQSRLPTVGNLFVVGLPLNGDPGGVVTSDDLLATFSSPFMFTVNLSGGFTTLVPGSNVTLEGGKGYILVNGVNTDVVFTGDGWCNVLVDPVNGVTTPCP